MNIFNIKMKSERLLLRNLRSSDGKDMYEYTSDNETTRYLEWDSHNDIKQTYQFIESSINLNKTSTISYVWGIELIQESKLIGVLRIYDYSIKDKRAEISYILNPNYSGEGYMTEAIELLFGYAFNKLTLNRIQAKCSVFNKGSEKVMKKTGMLFEGLMREYSYIKGEFHDELLYSITKSDFNSKTE
jgi:[ribosomal protein S5]-alanine N-acetyltransferase